MSCIVIKTCTLNILLEKSYNYITWKIWYFNIVTAKSKTSELKLLISLCEIYQHPKKLQSMGTSVALHK